MDLRTGTTPEPTDTRGDVMGSEVVRKEHERPAADLEKVRRIATVDLVLRRFCQPREEHER